MVVFQKPKSGFDIISQNTATRAAKVGQPSKNQMRKALVAAGGRGALVRALIRARSRMRICRCTTGAQHKNANR